MAETALYPLAPQGVPDDLALAWLAALTGGGHRAAAGEWPAFDRSGRIVLTGLASSVVSVLLGTPFEPDTAQAAGRALVAADFTGADVLGRSLRVLMARLPLLLRRVPDVPADIERRLAEVAGALATGYVSALQGRTLAELDAERAASRRLLHQATHDTLTGLPNRAEAFGRLAAALTAGPGTRVGLCYLDLDGFKAVNDRYGHAAGDQLLVEIADRIGRVSRAHGALPARIGGDEFVVLAENSPGLARTIALAADLIAEVRRPVTLTAGRLSVSACAGIVDRLAVGATARCLIDDADAAMYEAKSAGRGRYSIARVDDSSRQDDLACPQSAGPMAKIASLRPRGGNIQRRDVAERHGRADGRASAGVAVAHDRGARVPGRVQALDHRAVRA